MTQEWSASEIEANVRQAVAQSAGLRVDMSTVTRGTDLFEAGMASHASVNVMLAIEDLLEFQFPEDRIAKSTFTSIDSICRTIEQVL